MSNLPLSRAACFLLVVSLVFVNACTQQGEKGAEPPRGEAGVRVAYGQSEAVSDIEWESLSEQARVERSFARFLEGLRSSRVEDLPWDEASWERVDDLYQPYHERALAVQDLLASHAERDDSDAGGIREAFDTVRRELRELRERRLALSRAVAQHVFGLDPARNGELLSESHILDIIGTGREGMFPSYAGGAPSKRQARILAQMRELDPQARDEISFGQFLDILGSRSHRLWTRIYAPRNTAARNVVFDLKSDYIATSMVSPGFLWAYIQPKGKLESLAKMREMLDICNRALEELHEQRFLVSHAILKEVFGITDPVLLHEVLTGEASEE